MPSVCVPFGGAAVVWTRLRAGHGLDCGVQHGAVLTACVVQPHLSLYPQQIHTPMPQWCNISPSQYPRSRLRASTDTKFHAAQCSAWRARDRLHKWIPGAGIRFRACRYVPIRLSCVSSLTGSRLRSVFPFRTPSNTPIPRSAAPCKHGADGHRVQGGGSVRITQRRGWLASHQPYLPVDHSQQRGFSPAGTQMLGQLDDPLRSVLRARLAGLSRPPALTPRSPPYFFILAMQAQNVMPGGGPGPASMMRLAALHGGARPQKVWRAPSSA